MGIIMKKFVVFLKIDPSFAQKLSAYYSGIPIPEDLMNIRKAHISYMTDLTEKGHLFAGGPFADFSQALIIYQAESEEKVKELIEKEPYYVNGIFTDYTIWEWTIHLPLELAPEDHRERIREILKEMGKM